MTQDLVVKALKWLYKDAGLARGYYYIQIKVVSTPVATISIYFGGME